MNNKLAKAQKEVTRLWNLMCAAENVPVSSKFVEFDSANPFSADYNKAVKKYRRIHASQGGG